MEWKKKEYWKETNNKSAMKQIRTVEWKKQEGCQKTNKNSWIRQITTK